MIKISGRLRDAKHAFKNFDFILLSLTVAACLFGIMMIGSATGSYENAERYVLIQSITLGLGLVVAGVIMMIDYEYIANFSYIIFGISVVLLLIVFIPGIDSGLADKGSRRWIRFGSFGFQPSEIVKILFIITFAKHLSVVDEEITKPKNIALLLLHAGIIITLVMLEPDVGGALIFMVIFIVMLFVSGLPYKYFLWAGAGLVAFTPVAWFWILKDYQKTRIINFLYPENDPLNAGYQVIQSKIAVGSGKIFGKGLYHGVTQFGFLPERHNDFIFSVIGEELGLMGSIFVIVLLTSIIFRCMYIAQNAKNSLGMYIAAGVSAMLIFQAFENIGMCIGLMPVTGITLPFISYGGSSLITNLIAIGLVLNVRYRCKVINF